jgi:hypothetical protein
MVLLPLGVALVLATFRVVATMLRGGTWHRWVHGIAFLLIIAMGLLAPLTMALAGAGQPRLAADRGRFLRGYRALRCVPVLAVGQCFIPDGDRHCLRLDPCGCRTPSDPPTMTARSKSQIAFALAWTDQTGLVREDDRLHSAVQVELRQDPVGSSWTHWVAARRPIGAWCNWRERGATPRDMNQQVRELHALLARGLGRRAIRVGRSLIRGPDCPGLCQGVSPRGGWNGADKSRDVK